MERSGTLLDMNLGASSIDMVIKEMLRSTRKRDIHTGPREMPGRRGASTQDQED